MPGIKTYAGKDVSITFELKRCIHSEECGKRLPGVFDAHRRPWVEPDASDGDTIAAAVSNCPSGALHVYNKDGSATEQFEGPAEILARDDGPLYVRGDIQILGSDGSLISSETRVALCRCGRSENKPFCDNSHVGHFEASGPLGSSRTGADDESDAGELVFSLRENGPYILKGSFVIRPSDGSAEVTGVKGALCRCGHSSNKPFCDGTHREIGFEAE